MIIATKHTRVALAVQWGLCLLLAIVAVMATVQMLTGHIAAAPYAVGAIVILLVSFPTSERASVTRKSDEFLRDWREIQGFQQKLGRA